MKDSYQPYLAVGHEQYEYLKNHTKIMAIKQKKQPGFMDKPLPKTQKEKVAPPPPAIAEPDTKPETKAQVDQVSPRLFLSVNGFDQVHEGQRFPGTYEDVINLLQKYKAL